MGHTVSVNELAGLIEARFPGALLARDAEGSHPSITVEPQAWRDVARFLRHDPRTGFNFLRCVSALDLHPEPLVELVYDLIAMQPDGAGGLWRNAGTIAIRVRLPRDGASVASVADIWPAAEWHEREAFDLMGVRFEGHPDLRRILCPDDWVGHPLRKDYQYPTEYDGIPAGPAPTGGSQA